MAVCRCDCCPVEGVSQAAGRVGADGSFVVVAASGVVQASALLLAADGVANEAIARECATTADTVRRWRAKFEAGGVDAVGSIAPGRGRKPEIPQDVIDAIVNDTLHTVPDDESTAWSTRTMGERHGVGKDTVARIWRARKLRPWRVDTFKLSNDPALRGEAGRCRRPVPEPAGTGGGVQLRREDPVSRRWIGPSRRCRSSRVGLGR